MNKKMNSRGYGLMLLMLGIILSSACSHSGSSDDNDGGPKQSGGENTVGANGGVLEFLDGAVKMEFPAGAVSGETTISVEMSTAITPSFPMTLPNRFDFGPEGLTFSKPVKVTVTYDVRDIPADTEQSWLQLAKLDGESWQPVISNVDANKHAVSGEITGFSSWAITNFPGQFKRVRFPDKGPATRIIVRDIATDLQGDTILVGDSQDAVDGITPVNGGRDTFVARYADGFILSWVKQLDSTGADQAWRVAVTPTGVIGVAGTTTGAFAGTAPVSGTATFITTLMPEGNTRSGWPVQEDVIVSTSDSVIDIVGAPTQAFATLIGYPGPPLRTGLAIYDSDGNRLGLGPVDFGSPSGIVNSGVSVGISSVGNFVLAQTWALSGSVPEWTGWAVAGLDLAGAARTGYPIHQGETETGRPMGMAVDEQSNVFVVSFTDDSESRVRVSSFNMDGKPRSGWPAEFDVDSDTVVKSIAVDQIGNIYLAGHTGGDLGGKNAGGTDIFVTSFNASGNLRNNWPYQFGTADDDELVSMTVNGQGQVVMTGYIGTISTANQDVADNFVARLWLR